MSRKRSNPSLTAADRHALPNRDFAVPENEGLPIDTPTRARAAMARFNQYQFDSDAQKWRARARIMAKARKFGIDDTHFAEETMRRNGRLERHIAEIAEETGREMPVYEREKKTPYKSYMIESWYDEGSSYMYPWNAFAKGIGSSSGESREEAIDKVKRKIDQGKRNPDCSKRPPGVPCTEPPRRNGDPDEERLEAAGWHWSRRGWMSPDGSQRMTKGVYGDYAVYDRAGNVITSRPDRASMIDWALGVDTYGPGGSRDMTKRRNPYKDAPYDKKNYEWFREQGESADHALTHAQAEKWSLDNDVTVEWEHEESYDPDFGNWSVIARDADGESVGSLSGVDDEDEVDYARRRLIEAQVLDEAMYWATKPKKNPNEDDGQPSGDIGGIAFLRGMGIPDDKARSLYGAMKKVEAGIDVPYMRPGASYEEDLTAELLLQEIDRAADAHGVEALYLDSNGELSTRWGDFLASYVNTGDTYNGTVLWDEDEGRFYLTTYGDWVELWEKRRFDNEVESPTVYLDNHHDDDGESVTAYLRGPDACRIAKHHQSIGGSHWECSDDNLAYAILSDYAGLVGDLEEEGYDVNTDDYWEPGVD